MGSIFRAMEQSPKTFGRKGKSRNKKKRKASAIRFNLTKLARNGGNIRIKGMSYKEKNKSNVRNFLEEAKLYIKKRNLPFTIQAETPTDGDCFYHGQLDFLMDNQNLIERANFPENTDIKVSNLKTSIIEHRRS